MTAKKPLWEAVCDVLAVPAFWALQWLSPPRDALHRRAGFNAEVDERRELTIRMKLARGQKYLTSPDGWFLLTRLDDERNKV